jgi:hypothetical protein
VESDAFEMRELPPVKFDLKQASLSSPPPRSSP